LLNGACQGIIVPRGTILFQYESNIILTYEIGTVSVVRIFSCHAGEFELLCLMTSLALFSPPLALVFPPFQLLRGEATGRTIRGWPAVTLHERDSRDSFVMRTRPFLDGPAPFLSADGAEKCRRLPCFSQCDFH